MEGTQTMPRSSDEDEEVRLVRHVRASLRADDPELGGFANASIAISGVAKSASTGEKLEELDGVAVRNSKGTFSLEARFQNDASRIEQPLQMVLNLSVAIDVLDFKRRELVRECRARGRSWADIGEALGVSRQTAWEKYSSPED